MCSANLSCDKSIAYMDVSWIREVDIKCVMIAPVQKVFPNIHKEVYTYEPVFTKMVLYNCAQRWKCLYINLTLNHMPWLNKDGVYLKCYELEIFIFLITKNIDNWKGPVHNIVTLLTAVSVSFEWKCQNRGVFLHYFSQYRIHNL